MTSVNRSALQRRVWRWHFFAGLLVVPFTVIIALTGAIYLFKPQFDSAIEQKINSKSDFATVESKTIETQQALDAVLYVHPDANLVRLILPRSERDHTLEAEIIVNGTSRTVWVDKLNGAILHDVPTASRFMGIVKRIHGTLLSGDVGSLVVEIVACWVLILLLTGLYLWWPRGVVWWRAFIPELVPHGKRENWKRLHGSVGAWIGLVAVVMVLSGLPWTQVWGEGFSRAKALAGLQSPGQVWFVTLQSSDPHTLHEMGGTLWETENRVPERNASLPVESIASSPLSVDEIVTQAMNEGFEAPVWVQPPRGENGVWTVRGMSPNRLRQETVHYDRWTGEQVMRIRFDDHNIVDRTMALGVSFHEGALFGWFNQVIALLAALGIVGLSMTGAIMWWKRRPAGRMAVPPMPSDRKIAIGVVGLILILGVFLPMAGLTLIVALVLNALWAGVHRLRQTG